MRFSLLIAFVTVITTAALAQPTVVNSAIFARDNDDYAKAKNNIDAAVKHEKTKDDPKTWYYRGLIYQNLAQIIVDPVNYRWANAKNVSDEDIKSMQALSDNPVEVAYESYKKALEVDVKKRYDDKVDANLRDVLAFMAYNMGGIYFQEGVESKVMDKDKLMKAYHSYDLVFKIVDLMTEKSQAMFKANLNAQTGIDLDMNLVRFNMANAAFNAENWDLAQKEYEKLVDAKLAEFMIYRNLSYIYKKKDDVEAQRQLWKKATTNFDGSTALGKDLALEEAVFYQEIGELNTLIEKLENAIKLDPENSSLYNVLGGIYTQKIVDHNNALSEETPDKSMLLTDEDYKKYYSEAERLLKKAQELDPKETTNYTQLGSLYLSEGLVSYNANQRLTTSKADMAKGKVLTEKYKAAFAKSQKEYEAALNADPNDRIALEYLSKIHIWSGDLAKSIEYKNRLKELDSGN